MAVAVGEMFICSSCVPNSRFEEIYINDFRVLSETLLSSARCYLTHRAVENLSALQGIVWNLKQRRVKSRNEIKCYFFLIISRIVTHLAWLLLSI